MPGVFRPVTGERPQIDFPVGDLPDYFPDDLELHMQNHDEFERLHSLAEGPNYFYSTAHTAIGLVAEATLDGSSLTTAIDIGIRAYEVAGDVAAAGQGFYRSNEEMQIVYGSARNLVNNVQRYRDFLERLQYASGFLQSDAPRLAAVVDAVAARYLKHDRVAIDYALKAAALIRGMHIFVTREIAAAELSLEEQ